MYLQKVISRKNYVKKLVFCWHLQRPDPGSGSGSESISQRHGSGDPDQDPHQNVMDPQHCFLHSYSHPTLYVLYTTTVQLTYIDNSSVFPSIIKVWRQHATIFGFILLLTVLQAIQDRTGITADIYEYLRVL
jgi:hypothetical protein